MKQCADRQLLQDRSTERPGFSGWKHVCRMRVVCHFGRAENSRQRQFYGKDDERRAYSHLPDFVLCHVNKTTTMDYPAGETTACRRDGRHVSLGAETNAWPPPSSVRCGHRFYTGLFCCTIFKQELLNNDVGKFDARSGEQPSDGPGPGL